MLRTIRPEHANFREEFLACSYASQSAGRNPESGEAIASPTRGNLRRSDFLPNARDSLLRLLTCTKSSLLGHETQKFAGLVTLGERRTMTFAIRLGLLGVRRLHLGWQISTLEARLAAAKL